MEREQESNGTSPTTAPVLPKCQYCEADPAPVIPSPIAMGGAQAVVFHCGNPECRAIFSVQLVKVEQQRGSGLVVPG
jgi:hypothetical protein